MEQTTNLAAALGRTVLHAAWDGHRGIVPVDTAFIAKVRDGAMVWYATEASNESAYEFGQYKLVDGRPVWERKGVNGQVIGVQELAEGELDAKVLRMVDPTILDAVLLDDAGLSPIERVKLTAKLSGMVRELVAIPTGSTGTAALKRAKLAQAINALSVALGGQAQAVDAPAYHRAMLEAAAVLVRAEYHGHTVTLSDKPMLGTGRNLLTITRNNLIREDGGLVFEVWVTPDDMVGFQLRDVRGMPVGSSPAQGVISGRDGNRMNEVFRGQMTHGGGGEVATEFDIDKIEPMPTAAALGAGKKNEMWHAPVAMADGRTLWTNGEVLLLGEAAPFPDMSVGSLVKAGAKRQATAEVSEKVIARATSNATKVVQSFYGVDLEQAVYKRASNRTEMTNLPLVVMISGEDVVTVKRVYMALAENWCGDGCRILMGDLNDVVHLMSKDGKRDAFIAPTKLDLTADELKAASARRYEKSGVDAGPTVPPQAAIETVAEVDPNIGRKWRSKDGEIEITGYRNADKQSYVTTVDGKIGGAPIIPVAELEAYVSLDERQAADRAETLKTIAAEEQAVVEAKAKKTATYANIGGEGLQRGRTIKALDKKLRLTGGRIVTVKELVDEEVSAGATVQTRNFWNDRAGRAIPTRVLMSADNSFRDEKTIGKTGLDYAESLIGIAAALDVAAPSESPVAEASSDAAVQSPASVATPSSNPYIEPAKVLLRKFYADRGLTALAGRNVMSGATYSLADFTADFIKANPSLMPQERPARGTYSMSGSMGKAPFDIASVELEGADRGEWIIGYREWAGNYAAAMSTGVSLTANYDSYSSPPSFKAVAEQMIALEVYSARRTAQTQLEAEVDRTTAVKLTVGQVLKDVRIAGNNYSTLEVTAINAETGMLDVTLSKRGSKKRWTGTVPASVVAGSVLDSVDTHCVVLHESDELDESQTELELA